MMYQVQTCMYRYVTVPVCTMLWYGTDINRHKPVFVPAGYILLTPSIMIIMIYLVHTTISTFPLNLKLVFKKRKNEQFPLSCPQASPPRRGGAIGRAASWLHWKGKVTVLLLSAYILPAASRDTGRRAWGNPSCYCTSHGMYVVHKSTYLMCQ